MPHLRGIRVSDAGLEASDGYGDSEPAGRGECQLRHEGFPRQVGSANKCLRPFWDNRFSLLELGAFPYSLSCDASVLGRQRAQRSPLYGFAKLI